VSNSSSSAAERDFKSEFLKIIFFIAFVVLLIYFSIFFVNHNENNKFISETLQHNGSVEEGDALFKMNCVGCHGITARGLVGPDLHSITQRLNDKDIIKQVTGGLTPPMPSFEIDTVNMSNLLKYLHSLE
jgi:mono/diheme cytochrome c family protein